MLFAGIGSKNKSGISLLFSSYLTLVLSSPPCPLLHLFSYLKLSGRNCVLSPPVLSGYNWSPDTRFSQVTTWQMSWPDKERYLHPLQSLVVSLLLSLVSTLVFSQPGGVLSHRSSLTHRFPRFPPRKLCCLVTYAAFSLIYAPTNSLLLSSYLSRISRIKNPSCSACRHSSQNISHLILHCPATYSLGRSLFGDSLSLYDLWSRPWGVAQLLGLHGLPPCPHPSKGVG